MRLIVVPESPYARIVRMALIEKSLDGDAAVATVEASPNGSRRTAPGQDAAMAGGFAEGRQEPVFPRHAGQRESRGAADTALAWQIPGVPAPAQPALLVTDDGRVIADTTPILLHLDVIAPHPPLLRLDGGDAWRGVAEYGRAVALLDGIATWHRVQSLPDPEAAAAETRRTARLADGLEADVAEGCFSGGAAGWPDAAWIALAAALDHCRRRHPGFDWPAGRPALADWFEAATHRACFLLTSPPE